jgi:hypothetical protein
VHRPLSTLDRLVIFGVFLPIIGYCLYGAIAGNLYIPSRHGPGGAYFSGIHAWAFVASFTLTLVAVLVREREIGFMSDRARKVFELVLLAAGVGLLFVPRGTHTECKERTVGTQVAAASPVPNECAARKAAQ